MKYQEVAIYTKSKRFDEVRRLLKSEFKLIPPKPRAEVGFISTIGEIPDSTEKERLVFVDNNSRGVYRVDFKTGHNDGDIVFFRYWKQLLTPEIREQDPMLDAVRRTYELLKPERCASCAGGVILEEIVGSP